MWFIEWFVIRFAYDDKKSFGTKINPTNRMCLCVSAANGCGGITGKSIFQQMLMRFASNFSNSIEFGCFQLLLSTVHQINFKFFGFRCITKNEMWQTNYYYIWNPTEFCRKIKRQHFHRTFIVRSWIFNWMWMVPPCEYEKNVKLVITSLGTVRWFCWHLSNDKWFVLQFSSLKNSKMCWKRSN